MSLLLANRDLSDPKVLEVCESSNEKNALANNERKHVLQDLKPYVCTFEDCELKLFPDRHTWFSHELKNHRQEWQCYFCSKTSHRTFDTSSAYREHLARHHPGTFAKDQESALLEMSQRALAKLSPAECPFCESWEEQLRAINQHVPSVEALAVTPSQFQHHVAVHMEQLALFAIPRGYTEVGEADSGSAVPQADSDGSCFDSTDVSPKDAQVLRNCEDILRQITEDPESSYMLTFVPLPTLDLWLPERGKISKRPLDPLEILQKLERGDYVNPDALLLDMCVLFATQDALHKRSLSVENPIRVLFADVWREMFDTKSLANVREQIYWKLSTFNRFPTEAPRDAAHTMRVTIRMANGKRATRRFQKSSGIEQIYAFVECFDLEEWHLRASPRIIPGHYDHSFHFVLRMATDPTPSGRRFLNPLRTIGEAFDGFADLVVVDFAIDETPQFFDGSLDSLVEEEGSGKTMSTAGSERIREKSADDFNPPYQLQTETAECRKQLTLYAAYTLRKVTPDNPNEVASWAKIEVTREQWSQSKIAHRIMKLDESSTSVTDKKTSLAPHQQGQVSKLLEDIGASETNPDFEWVLAQLERKERPVDERLQKQLGKSGRFLYETLTMTLYVSRAPLRDINPVDLLRKINASNEIWRRSPPPMPKIVDLIPGHEASTTLERWKPTLSDILLDKSPPPWTLSAFRLFLFQHQRLETLEFTVDARKYEEYYLDMVARQPQTTSDSLATAYLRNLWKKMMDKYVTVGGPKEVRLTSDVRAHLLSLSYTDAPPNAKELGSAMGAVLVHMEEVLRPFLDSTIVPSKVQGEITRIPLRSEIEVEEVLPSSSKGKAPPIGSALPLNSEAGDFAKVLDETSIVDADEEAAGRPVSQAAQINIMGRPMDVRDLEAASAAVQEGLPLDSLDSNALSWKEELSNADPVWNAERSGPAVKAETETSRSRSHLVESTRLDHPRQGGEEETKCGKDAT